MWILDWDKRHRAYLRCRSESTLHACAIRLTVDEVSSSRGVRLPADFASGFYYEGWIRLCTPPSRARHKSALPGPGSSRSSADYSIDSAPRRSAAVFSSWRIASQRASSGSPVTGWARSPGKVNCGPDRF